MFFHAGVQPFSGGYVGVDVFFVISGYLITSILAAENASGRFSLLAFYERRARRILPALFFVMLCCTPIAWLLLLPSQLEEFAQSVVAVSFFVSNVFFWQQSGYFGSEAEEQPLLHTWSLAVEEQYYLLFPVLLLFLWRQGDKRIIYTLVVLSAISLAASEWGARAAPTANFYLTHSRVWELLAGSITAFLVRSQGVRSSDALSLLGVCAILIPVFLYDDLTPFPSVYALIPVVGTCLIILYCDGNTMVGRIIKLPPLVGVGLISYSFYLWHQPVFAFARLASDEPLRGGFMLSLITLALVGAYLSWRFIEQPFREKRFLSRNAIFGLSVAAAVAFGAVGLTVAANIRAAKGQEIVVPVAISTDADFVVVGDSHAEHLIDGLRSISSGTVLDMTSAGCIPFRDVDRYDTRFVKGACAAKMNRFIDRLGRFDKPATVVLSTMGPVYLDGTAFKGMDKARVKGQDVALISDTSVEDHYEIFEIGLRQTLRELLQNKKLKLVFAIDVPELGISFGCRESHKSAEVQGKALSMLSDPLKTAASECRVSRLDYDERASRYKTLVRSIVRDFPEVMLFDPTPHFCDLNTCYGYIDGFGFLYRDYDHLSANGSNYFASALVSAIRVAD